MPMPMPSPSPSEMTFQLKRNEIMARLVAGNREDTYRRGLYPLIADELAGNQVNGHGVAVVVYTAVARYAQGVHAAAQPTMGILVEQIVAALIRDPAMLRDAKEALRNFPHIGT